MCVCGEIDYKQAALTKKANKWPVPNDKKWSICFKGAMIMWPHFAQGNNLILILYTVIAGQC